MILTDERAGASVLRLLHADPTPCQPLPRLGALLGVDLWVKRDDLFPTFAGGNKARKMSRLLPQLERRRRDAVVTTGSAFSNHARAVALAAAQQGWACTLVLHGTEDDLGKTLNGRLLESSGAELRFVQPDRIAGELARAARDLRTEGRRPVIIEGGGHTLRGTLAYTDALYELDEQRGRRRSAHPVVVVTPVGTGSTHAGLHVGAESLPGYRIVGVSIARPQARATAVAEASCAEARASVGQRTRRRPVEIHDDWTEGGYAVTSDRVESVVRMALREEGLVLDETYSGKALLGLMQLVERGRIRRGSEVWFLHTGGWPTIGATVSAAARPRPTLRAGSRRAPRA